jgi:uncharacterized membrane protein YvbJ
MSLEKCNECNSLMSNQASACLNCGYPIAESTSRHDQDIAVSPGQGRQAYEKWQDLALFGTLASVLILIVITIAQT